MLAEPREPGAVRGHEERCVGSHQHSGEKKRFIGCAAEVLDSVSSASDLAKLETIYELTLDALKATANQRPLGGFQFVLAPGFGLAHR